ncbi:MAG: prolipoprotein diacylglyceryl transferase [Oscillospiraceae bacterium]|nr:prolipoprotein diacylglyceryl transferase [Oscillospiraceae bacterium]
MIIHRPTFPLYGIIILLSLAAGMLYIYRSLRSAGCRSKDILLYFIMFMPFALVSGKLYTVITDPSSGNIFTAGLSSYGGLAGTVAAALIFERILPENGNVIRYTVLSLPLIYGLSKTACFFAGCCYGIPYDGPLSVTYPDGLGIPLFPVQLAETAVFLIMFLVCHTLREKRYISHFTLMTVAAAKLLLDFLRYDHVSKLITANQIFSIMLFAAALTAFCIGIRKERTQ